MLKFSLTVTPFAVTIPLMVKWFEASQVKVQSREGVSTRMDVMQKLLKYLIKQY